MSKESGLDRVVGASPEDEEVIRDHFKKTFDTRFLVGADGRSLERKKSPELEQGIKAISSYMHGFLGQYGAQALDIRPDQVHLIDREQVPQDLLEKVVPNGALGCFSFEQQWIFIFHSEGQRDKRATAKTIAHEMIHFNSFASLQLKIAEGTIKTRRFGIEAKSGGFTHFKELNEAVTEELAIRFAMEHFRDISYTSEEAQKDLEKAQPNIDLLERILPESPNDYVREVRRARIEELKTDAILADSKSYPDERERLYQMINEIFEANKDQFKDKDEVFKIFVNAMLKGRLLPLARIIDKTYGKGRFAELAEDMEELTEVEKAA